jgi:hypothetical protein
MAISINTVVLARIRIELDLSNGVALVLCCPFFRHPLRSFRNLLRCTMADEAARRSQYEYKAVSGTRR